MTTLDDRTTALARINAGNWQRFAACRGEDPELFFPVGVTNQAMSQAEDAKAVCFRCDAIGWCRQWALETGQDAGVLGGMSEDERRALKRREARARQKEAAAAEALTDGQLLDGLVSS